MSNLQKWKSIIKIQSNVNWKMKYIAFEVDSKNIESVIKDVSKYIS